MKLILLIYVGPGKDNSICIEWVTVYVSEWVEWVSKWATEWIIESVKERMAYRDADNLKIISFTQQE